MNKKGRMNKRKKEQKNERKYNNQKTKQTKSPKDEKRRQTKRKEKGVEHANGKGKSQMLWWHHICPVKGPNCKK